MNIDKNAKLTPLGAGADGQPACLLRQAAGRDDVGRLVSLPNYGHTPAKAAALAGVCPGTVKTCLLQAGMADAFACMDAGVPPCRGMSVITLAT